MIDTEALPEPGVKYDGRSMEGEGESLVPATGWA